MNIIVEGILKSQGEFFISSLDSNSQGSKDRSVASPWVGNKSCCIEQSGPNNIGLEIFLDSALFDSPAKNLNVGIGVVSNFDLVKSITIPVVTLSDVTIVEVEVHVVVVSKIVGGVDIRFVH